MISESEILKFDAQKQGEIRKEIKLMSDNGYQPRYMVLLQDGSIALDRELIESDALFVALNKMKKP